MTKSKAMVIALAKAPAKAIAKAMPYGMLLHNG